jgi:hypothetical protein
MSFHLPSSPKYVRLHKRKRLYSFFIPTNQQMKGTLEGSALLIRYTEQALRRGYFDNSMENAAND